MKKWDLLGQVKTPDGSLMTLHTNGTDRVIRVNGRELMSSRHVHSEEQLAVVGCAGLRAKPAARVLIGGLGLGFTLRAALAELGPDASVVVAELMPEVLAWNQNPEFELAADCLGDPRARVEITDVGDLIRSSRATFDAILLDTDNGTTAMNTPANARLYQERGVREVITALRPGGVVVYWSAGADPIFERLMTRCGLRVEVQRPRIHPSSAGTHYLLIGRLSR